MSYELRQRFVELASAARNFPARHNCWFSPSGREQIETQSPPLVAGFFMRGRMGGMRYRKLRIAWSVAWGLAAVLLIVLWVRSYWCAEVVARFNPNWRLNVGSNHGVIYFVYDKSPPRPTSSFFQPIQYGSVSTVSTPYWSYCQIEVVAPGRWLEWKDLGSTVIGQVPDFLLVGLCVVGAVVPLWPRRYSMRTLLIATTLVAVVLGLVVWAA
jgi:hypothetical protein